MSIKATRRWPRVLVTGAAGFIGHHLVNYLCERDYWVRAVDYRPNEWGHMHADEVDWQCDLRHYLGATKAMKGIDWVFALAADMGGMGFIMNFQYTVLRNSARINLNTAEAAAIAGIERLLYTSSACIYPEGLQTDVDAPNLKESDAWQGKPEASYGVEKMVAEEIYYRAGKQFGFGVRMPRFHNIYGPEGAWDAERDNRVKAPAAMCYKAAKAKLTGSNQMEIWGDGKQTRSFCYISDALEMMHRLMCSNFSGPMNIGTDHLITINDLAMIAARAAGLESVELVHVEGPQGVRGRNADLNLMRAELNYWPQTSLESGMQRTYDWIEKRVKEKLDG